MQSGYGVVPEPTSGGRKEPAIVTRMAAVLELTEFGDRTRCIGLAFG
jgi:hypothetical protein